LPNEVSLDQEQKEILIDLLDSLIFRQSFITMTFKFVHKGNTKNGGFLANLFTMMSTLSMNVIDESRLEGKSDLKKELRELNKIINEDKQPKKHYTISDLFRKKMRELEIQSDKESNDYFSNKKKLKANKIQGNITPDTSVFYIDYLTKLFSLIPLELLNKLKFLNYDAAVHLSHLTDRGRQFYVPMDNKYERFYLYRKNQSS